MASMASENGARWTWAEAKQRESGLEGCAVRESAWPVGVRWRETVEEERALRRYDVEVQRVAAGHWRVVAPEAERMKGLF